MLSYGRLGMEAGAGTRVLALPLPNPGVNSQVVYSVPWNTTCEDGCPCSCRPPKFPLRHRTEGASGRSMPQPPSRLEDCTLVPSREGHDRGACISD